MGRRRLQFPDVSLNTLSRLVSIATARLAYCCRFLPVFAGLAKIILIRCGFRAAPGTTSSSPFPRPLATS